MKVKLVKCASCRKYPFVEVVNRSIKHPLGTLKIFCEHKYFEGENHADVAGNWNIHNSQKEAQ